jgi:transposase-like protein
MYLAENAAAARRVLERFRFHWRGQYPAMVNQLERGLPELLQFYQLSRHLWRKLRTTNVIERCFVEIRRRTRPMVVFTNMESVDRIIYAIFSRFNEDWKNHTLKLLTQAA